MPVAVPQTRIPTATCDLRPATCDL